MSNIGVKIMCSKLCRHIILNYVFGNHEKQCFMAYDLFVSKMLNFEALLSKLFVRKITVGFFNVPPKFMWLLNVWSF